MEIMRVVSDLVATRRIAGLSSGRPEGKVVGGGRSGRRAAGEMGFYRRRLGSALCRRRLQGSDRSDDLRDYRSVEYGGSTP